MGSSPLPRARLYASISSSVTSFSSDRCELYGRDLWAGTGPKTGTQESERTKHRQPQGDSYTHGRRHRHTDTPLVLFEIALIVSILSLLRLNKFLYPLLLLLGLLKLIFNSVAFIVTVFATLLALLALFVLLVFFALLVLLPAITVIAAVIIFGLLLLSVLFQEALAI